MKPSYNTTHTYQKAVTVTVQEIYGTTYPKIPEGWESTGEFRPPKEGEVGLSSLECDTYTYTDDESDKHPRIILRKVKEKYSDTEILDFVLKWLYSDVAYNGVTTKNGEYAGKAGPIFQQLVTSSFSIANHKELREVISAEMREKGI